MRSRCQKVPAKSAITLFLVSVHGDVIAVPVSSISPIQKHRQCLLALVQRLWRHNAEGSLPEMQSFRPLWMLWKGITCRLYMRWMHPQYSEHTRIWRLLDGHYVLDHWSRWYWSDWGSLIWKDHSREYNLRSTKILSKKFSVTAAVTASTTCNFGILIKWFWL